MEKEYPWEEAEEWNRPGASLEETASVEERDQFYADMLMQRRDESNGIPSIVQNATHWFIDKYRDALRKLG